MLSLLVIAVADGLSDDATTRALDAGPEYVSAAVGYPALFLSAGYERIDLIDVTDEYRMTLAAWVSAWDANSSELQQVLGDGDFAERQARRRMASQAVDDGLLRRYLISAVRA